MQLRDVIIITGILCGVIVFAGCTTTPASSSVTTAVTGTPAGTSSGSIVGTLTTGPTSVVPDYNKVVVDVGVKDYLGNIEVIYQGGEGQIHVKKITATITRADGRTQTKSLQNSKGYTVEFEGTKQTDRVEIWVSMDNGETYKINDELREYRIH